MKIYWPVLGAINSNTEEFFYQKLNLTRENDTLVSYLSSHGGEANVTSRIIEKLSILPIETIVYSGRMAYSSGAIIYSAFKKRFAFKDSEFLIHECIPPKGVERGENFHEYDQQIWQFMSEHIGISVRQIEKIAKKGERMTSEQAFDIGLVDEIVNSSWRNFKDLIIL